MTDQGVPARAAGILIAILPRPDVAAAGAPSSIFSPSAHTRLPIAPRTLRICAQRRRRRDTREACVASKGLNLKRRSVHAHIQRRECPDTLDDRGRREIRYSRVRHDGPRLAALGWASAGLRACYPLLWLVHRAMTMTRACRTRRAPRDVLCLDGRTLT